MFGSKVLLKEKHSEDLVSIVIIPAIVLSIAISLLAFKNAVEWVGKPFPGFFYYKNLVVSVYQRSAWARHDNFPRAYDHIMAINGVPVKSADEFRKIFDSNTTSNSLSITVNRGGDVLTFHITPRVFSLSDFVFTFLLPFILGLFFIVSGSLIYFVKPSKATLINFFMTILIALSYITMFDASTTHRFSSLWLIYPLFGAVSVHLFLLFPKEWEFIKKNHWLCYVPYLPAAALIVFRSTSEYNPQLSIIFSKLSLLFMALVFVIDFTLLSVTYKKSTESVIKQRAKIVAYGLVLAALIPVAWSTLYAFWRPVIGVEYAIVLAVFFPILVGYAATKSKFFDIDLVIKKSISYALISSLLVLLYLLVVAIVSLFTQTLLALDSSPLEQIISTLAVVVAFDPLRRGVQHLIDRAFYRDRYLVQKGLLELSHRLSTEVFDVEEVASLVIRRLKEVAMYSASYMFLDDGNGRLVLEYSDPSSSEPFVLKASPIKSGILSSGEVVFLDDLRANRDLDGNDFERLSRLGVQCLVPMVTKGGLMGLVALANPLSSLGFSSDEKRLIESIAHQTAMSIENKRLYEQKSRDERLATLGKVSSMIIHEIKNPLGIIRVSSGALKKRFEKENEKECLELASFIEEEVIRMDSTVRKFLAYVKPQEPAKEVVNINELVRKAVYSLRCELEPFSVELRLDSCLDGIIGDADHIYQLIVNLIFNAKDAMKPPGRLIICTKDAGEAVYLTVADSGKGIEKELQESIFKPFYSGRRGGIGLGLTIAQQIVENHGGVIRLKSKVGAGTVFRVLLPRRGKEARVNWKN